ncbi:hypothetical protein quinque_000003, partial [Culex quinquefasciatus]
MRNQFIDSQLFTKTLEVILTINPPSSELNADYKISSVLEHATSVLDRTVEQFPPCWLDLRASYQGIIFGSLEEDCFSRYDRSEGLLKVVLFLLETCVESDLAAGRLHKTASSNMTSMMATFHQWEMENNQKYDFDLLSRDERFERLFIVLSILVKILELDLSMWILRHPHKHEREHAKGHAKATSCECPLERAHSTVGEVNSFVRRIVALYVNMVALRFPAEDVRVVARLLSVIGTTINLSEIQYDGTVDYPCIKDNTPLLCPANFPPGRILPHLVKGRWRKLCRRRRRIFSNPPTSPSERYPFLDRRRIAQVRPRNRPHAVREPAADRLPRLHASVPRNALLRKLQTATPRLQPVTLTRSPQSPPKRLSTEQLRGHRFDFRALERRINVLEVQRKRSRTIVRPAAERPVPVDAAPLVLEEVNVTPALLVYYRDELEAFAAGAALAEDQDGGGAGRTGHALAGWRKYLASIDETLSCE